MKIVVLGNGLVYDAFKEFDFAVIDNDISTLDLSALDEFDVIVNAYESKSDDVSAMYIYNAEVPAGLNEYCVYSGKRFVHISTGDLYDNSMLPQSETAVVSVKTNYETTKLLGESYCDPSNTLILRPKNLFNETINQNNSLYKLMCTPSNIDIPVSFTHTNDLIRSMTKLLREKKTGIFNVSSNGMISPFKISPAQSYMKKDCIADLNLTSNVVSILNTDKLFQYHVTDDVEVQLLESISAITNALKSTVVLKSTI